MLFLEKKVIPSRSPKKKIIVAAGGFCVLIALAIVSLAMAYYMPNYFIAPRHAYIHVQDDMTARDIADVLHEKGLISNTLWFRVAAIISGQAQELKKGEYVLDSQMSMESTLAKLASGKSEATRVVVPEGYSCQQIARDLEKQGIVKAADFLAAVKKPENLYPYMKGNRTVSFPAEGFLFPDTYFIPNDATPDAIAKTMLKEFDDHLTAEMKQKIAKRNLSIYQFVTLASLVEKEARYEEDRAPIAAVFFNRLSTGMPLQSDACISYVLGMAKTNVSIQDTKLESPYNTYVYKGLPPGPIASPGMAAMNAVLDAPDTDYLFFVADSDGHNHFIRTYEEHLKAVEEYSK